MRMAYSFAFLALVLSTCDLSDASKRLVQEESPATQSEDGKYRVDRAQLLQDTHAGLKTISTLLDEAIKEPATDLIIAQLRIEKVVLSIACGGSDGNWQPVHEILDPILSDPEKLLGEYESGRTYVEAVSAKCSIFEAEHKGGRLHEQAIQNAIDDVEAAMALSDVERAMLIADLRRIGSRIESRRKNLAKAAEWLSPIFSEGKLLVEDPRGARMYTFYVRQQTSLLAELKKLDECQTIFETAIGQLKASSQLPIDQKLDSFTVLIAEQLELFSVDPVHRGASAAWVAALEQMKTAANYEGIRSDEVHAGGLFLHIRMLSFLADRDFDESLQVADNATRLFDLDANLRKNTDAVKTWFRCSKQFLTNSASVDDPRRNEFVDRCLSLLQKLEDEGFDESEIKKYSSGIRSLVAPRAEPEKDKYSVDSHSLMREPKASFDKLGKLIEQAIIDKAPDVTVAKLRVEKARAAHNLSWRTGDWRLAHEELDPIVQNPDALLRDFELAKQFLRAIELQCEVVSHEFDDHDLRDNAISTAINRIEDAMALGEFERLLLVSKLRSRGSHYAREREDFAKAAEWLNPILTEDALLISDARGVDEWKYIVQQQIAHFARLGRIEDCNSVFQAAFKSLKFSNVLSEREKLGFRGTLVSDQFLVVGDEPEANAAKDAWQAAVEYLEDLKKYDGPEKALAEVGGIFARTAMVGFLRNRDLDKSVDLVHEIYNLIDAHPKIFKHGGVVNQAVHASTFAIRALVASADPRHRELEAQVNTYLDKLEKQGFRELEVEKFRDMIRK